MGGKAKKLISILAVVSIVISCITVVPAQAAPTDASGFDPETVMWTNRPIEDVLAQTGKYETVKQVNPNAEKSTDALNIQNPYGKPGEHYQSWDYSEFVWTNFYPIGNGRMAGMVAGGIDNEVIQINEDTCWDGSPYGTLKDESGNTVSTMEQAYKTVGKITAEDMTSGSKTDGWRYFRGADENDEPAAIGAENVTVGDAAFRQTYPDFASKSIAYQALNIDNAANQAAVQDRWNMEKMVEATFLGNPTKQRAYKSFVEVFLDFGHKNENASNYTKSLDMKTGIVTVEYDYNGAHFKRESFASYPDQVVVTHVESSEAADFSAELHTYHVEKGESFYTYEKVSDKEVKVKAAVTNGGKDNNIGQINVINFEAHMYLDGDGTFSVADDNKTVNVTGGTSNTVYVVGATNYVDYKTLDNNKPAKDCEYYMDNVKSKTYDQIKTRHLADFTEQFSKTDLSLSNSSGVDYSDTPTEKRVRKDISGKSGFLTGAASRTSDANKNGVKSTYSEGDNQLAALEWNYGKYLILSGSRDGRTASGAGEINIPESQPLNLTGKWNAAFSASWNGKYTININTEMNYWAAQPLNIGDSERPFIDTFDELAASGSITAANQYGIFNDRGDNTYQPGDPWVMHHNYDLWRGTQPIDNATAGLWPTGGAWLLDHAWQYYKFNKDEAYLAEVYPYMVGAAKFFTQFLVKDPKTGYLITAASCSPEQGGVQPGPAMDTQLVRNLYDMVQQASKILGKEQENADLLAKIAEQMPSSYLADEAGKVAPNVIDNAGLIKEWVRGDVAFDISKKDSGQWTVKNPFKNNEETKVYNHEAKNTTNHRHCSHLWEIFPGTHLSGYSDDPNEQKIFKAYQKSVSARSTGSGQGWGLAWRINLNARALDGNAASNMLEQLFTTRTSPNLFDQHPNFQIDGNYGATSGIIEMLIQSHDGAITLLPALPDKWAEGSFKGFKTREGATVDLSWSASKPKEAKIYATETKDISVRSKYMSEAKITDESGTAVAATLNDDRTMATFPAEAGKTYTITNFGTNVVEGNRVYKASDVKEFYSSDGNKNVPKPSSAGIGTLRHLNGVKVGYAVNDVDFEGLKTLTLNMASVRYDDTYVAVMVDTVNGTEIAKQLITTGDNVLDLKNIENISGTHKIWLLFWQDPFDGKTENKYLGDSSDLTAFYSKTIGGDTDPTTPPDPTPTPTDTPTPANYDYKITEAYFDGDGMLNANIEYSGAGTAPSAVLIAAAYDGSGKLVGNPVMQPISGAGLQKITYEKPENGTVKLYIWKSTDSVQPLGMAKTPSDSAPSKTTDPSETTEPSKTTDPSETTEPEGKGAYIGNTKYDTVGEAVAAAAATNPTSEEQRVYIDIMPGTYREQIVVKTPYITLRKKDGTSGNVVLTWYYGQGSMYDSCNSSGFYDPSAIGDGEGHAPKNWGAALNVDKAATGFTAESLVVENSYNKYYTQEELTDITGVDPDTNNSNFKRLDWIKAQIANNVSDDKINAKLTTRENISGYGTDGKEYSPRERCAALYCSADKSVFTNCEIMSTQDTIGINSGRMYFKNCKLGGTTDFICGSAQAVFDGCELVTNAGSTGSAGESATFTAPSNGAESEGYLFYNCRITGTEHATAGSFGRPWGTPPGPAAAYINTKIGKAAKGSSSDPYLISATGWTDMSGNKPEEARFYEYGSVDDSGKAIDTTKRKGKLLDEWTMLRYNPYVFTKGTDDWDPAGVKSKYAGVDGVLSETTIDTSDGTTNEIDLPTAPQGYEFKWESDSEFAVVSGNKLSLIRPANGETPIDATVKLYARESANQGIGAEKSIPFEIQPTSDTENVFKLSGTVTLSKASGEDQAVKIEVKKNEAVIKTINVTIPAGQTSVTYTGENIPVGTYTVFASTSNAEYNISTPSASITGAKGETQTFNVSANKMTTITLSDGDFSILTPTITAASGFTASVYTATGTESAKLGEAGNKVYKLTKEAGKTVKSNVGVSFNLLNLGISSLKNTKTIKFSYDFLMETTEYYPSDYTYLDLVTDMLNNGENKADPARFVRWGVYKGWGQFNMFGANNARINGDNTQFDKNSTMANKWYRIEALIDLENKSITSTLYNRDNGMAILNNKPFTIVAAGSADYPTNVSLNNLYFNIYMDNKGNTSNKMEYYIDNISIEYQDFE